MAAARRRFKLPVTASRAKCSHCRSDWCDIYGNHQGSCPGGDQIQRHNAVRDLIHQAAKSAGFCSGLEYGGSLDSAERPGDVVIFGLEGTKSGRVDVAVIEPLLTSHIEALTEG